jgi:hypothetical protein
MQYQPVMRIDQKFFRHELEEFFFYFQYRLARGDFRAV